MGKSIVELPSVTLQSSIREVIADIITGKVKKDRIFASCSCKGNSVHEYISVYKENGDIKFKAENGSGGIFLESLNDKFTTWKVNCPSLNISNYTVYAPSNIYTSSSKSIESFDLSPNQEFFLSGDSYGELTIFPTKRNSFEQRNWDAHFTYISSTKIFPSGKAAITVGGDMLIKIWDLVDRSNPRTFKPKSKTNCIGIIGKGRNVAAGSQDGCISIWECGSAEVVKQIKPEKSILKNQGAVTSLLVATSNENLDSPSTTRSENDLLFEMDDKLLYAGHENGSTALYDLRDNKLPLVFGNDDYRLENSNSITAIASFDNITITGDASGVITQWDLRKPNDPICLFQKSSSLINSIFYSKKDDSVISISSDTLPIKFSLSGKSICSFSGLDSPSTEAISREGSLFVSTRSDGIFRY